jgi:hypothetical protein
LSTFGIGFEIGIQITHGRLLLYVSTLFLSINRAST